VASTASTEPVAQTAVGIADLIDVAQGRYQRHLANRALAEKPKMGQLQMDWLRSADLKEEKNVTAPVLIIAGEGGLTVGRVAHDRTRRTFRAALLKMPATLPCGILRENHFTAGHDPIAALSLRLEHSLVRQGE